MSHTSSSTETLSASFSTETPQQCDAPMPISRRDLPSILAAIENLYRVMEGASPTAERLQLRASFKTAMEQLLVLLMPSGVHTHPNAPDIYDSKLDQRHRWTLNELRERILVPEFLANQYAIRPGKRLDLLCFLEEAVRSLSDGQGGGIADSKRSIPADNAIPSPDGNGVGGKPGDQSSQCPDWVNRLFRAKQFALLKALFGRADVEERALCEVLGYTDPVTKAGNLDRRVTETNKNLCERTDDIGENWTIRERTREGIKYYFLERQK